MSRRRSVDVSCGLEPTVADLLAIEAEAPLLAAELDLVDAEIAAVVRPCAEARARVRRAEAALVAVLLDQLNHPLISQGA